MAISVNLTDPARVAGFVNPGSEVAIFWTGARRGRRDHSPGSCSTRVTVLGVGSTTPVSTTTTDESGASTTEQLPRTLLTLSLTQAQTQKVLLGASTGELAFGLLTDESAVADADPRPPPTTSSSEARCPSSLTPTRWSSRPCWPSMPAGSHGVESVDRLNAWLSAHSDEYVVVLGPTLTDEEAVVTCEVLRTTAPAISTVLAREELDRRAAGRGDEVRRPRRRAPQRHHRDHRGARPRLRAVRRPARARPARCT